MLADRQTHVCTSLGALVQFNVFGSAHQAAMLDAESTHGATWQLHLPLLSSSMVLLLAATMKSVHMLVGLTNITSMCTPVMVAITGSGVRLINSGRC